MALQRARMGDRVAAALTHRREDLLEIGTGIDGDDPGTDVDHDSAWPGVLAIGDDRADYRHEVGKVDVTLRTAAAFPTT